MAARQGVQRLRGQSAPATDKRATVGDRSQFDWLCSPWSSRDNAVDAERTMDIAHSVAEILTQHVTLEVESIDRMYLNLYVPRLQYEGGVVGFFRHHRGHAFASSALMAPMSTAFVRAIENFIGHKIPRLKLDGFTYLYTALLDDKPPTPVRRPQAGRRRR